MRLIKRVLLGFSAVLFIVFCTALVVTNKPSLGWQVLNIATGSMRPAISQNSMVLVHSVPTSSLKVGDVITYTSPKNNKITITHRIVGIIKVENVVPAFVAKGDANSTKDPIVVGGMIQGKVLIHIPYIGFALNFIKKPIGYLSLIYLPALLLIIDEVRKLAEYFKSLQSYTLHQPEVKSRNVRKRYLLLSTAMSTIIIVVVIIFSAQVYALLKSNKVVLTNNTITVAPKVVCTGNNNTNVVINNSSNQSVSSGNVSSSDNTNSGNITSGNANATDSTSINVNISNC